MSTWILLRGLTRESRHWGDFPQILRQVVPAATVLTLDLPGNGRFHHLPSPTRVEDMAAFCRRELQRLGVAPPYHLLAMSLGAMVAVAWGHEHPQDLAGCVLVNTSLRPVSPFFHRLRPRNYLPLARLMLRGTSDPALEQNVLRMTSAHPEAHAPVIDSWVRVRKDRPVTRANALRQLLAAASYRAPEKRPTPRLLILASRGDGLVDPRCSQRLADRWGSEIAWHPDAGHDLPLDDGPWVAAQVRRWLQA